jgi:hypothetical protein
MNSKELAKSPENLVFGGLFWQFFFNADGTDDADYTARIYLKFEDEKSAKIRVISVIRVQSNKKLEYA